MTNVTSSTPTSPTSSAFNSYETPLTTSPDQALDGLSEAVSSIAKGLNLDTILNRLAETAAMLVNTKYAALGIPDGKGGLERFFAYGLTPEQGAMVDHLPSGRGLLGALTQQTEALRLERMSDDPRSVGFCGNHPIMTSFLGVPIISRGQHVGVLYLSDRHDGQPFSEQDEKMVKLLADHAAIAIENARLFEELRKLAIVEERDRIGMELHDGIIQSVYAIGIRLEIARLAQQIPSEFDTQLQGAIQDLNGIIDDIRAYIRGLKGAVNYTADLYDQLRDISGIFGSISTARLTLDVAKAFSHLNADKVHAITQISREILSNAVRHSGASEVTLSLHENPRAIVLQVADNGKGFDLEDLQTGRGLTNMVQRAKRLGGNLTIDSQIGKGTTITLTLPH